MIHIRTTEEIELLHQAAQVVSRTLGLMAKEVKPGVTTLYLDKIAEEYIRSQGAIPGFLGLYGFPNTLCMSPNAQVVHGIPNDRPLQEGDIISIDCGALKNGYYGDHAYTFEVGEVAPEVKELLRVTKESLYIGIRQFRAGNRVGDVGHAIQQHCEAHGYGVVRELVGHGVGRKMHEDPEMPNYGAGDYTQVKKKIFGKLVNYISPQFAYYENAHVGIAEFLDSLLFKAERYTLKGGDQIVGHYNGMPFQSSNLSVTFRPNFRNEKEGDDVVFYGNYFVARSPKKFEHPIVIHPVKGFFSDLKDNEIATYLNRGGEKIRLEDPEFQKQFEVYCDDQITARYVLTPAFMQRLKKLNERHKGQVYIAINKYNIVIATNEGNALMRTDNSPTAMLFQKIDLGMVESVYRELIEQLQMLDTIGGRG